MLTNDQQPVNSAMPEPPSFQPTPHLPGTGAGYGKDPRVAADPIGRAGLPSTREGLNALLLDLCRRLISAGGSGLGGRRLALEMNLRGTRALRLLVAYGHVHHRLRQIVGVPGLGYKWGDFWPQIYKTMAAQARQMGRCFFFNSALYSHRPPAIEAAQLVLDFVGQAGDQSKPARDELSVMMAAENVGIEDVLSAVMELLADSHAGRAALVRVGRKHAQVLLPTDAVRSIRDKVDILLHEIDSMSGQAVPAGVQNNS
jgi:hypothetical protein